MTTVHRPVAFDVPAILSLAGLASLGLAPFSAARSNFVGSWYRGSSGSIATGNRHGGPHEHRREIARRRRQQTAEGMGG